MKNITLICYLLFLSRLAFGQGGTTEVVICNGTTVRLRAESTGAVNYEWHKDGQIIPGFSGKELVVSEEGNYAAFALNLQGCISDQSVVVIIGFRRPIAVDDYISGKINQKLLITVLQNDQQVCTPLNPSTLTVKTNPTHGTLVKDREFFHYTPAPGYDKTDIFTYSVKDKDNKESNIAKVIIDLSIGALPVTLAAFEAERKESVTLVTWSTTSEINSKEFEIQRSTDGKNWTAIGTVPTTGTGTAKENYQFTDLLPESGLNYYRLKMIDQDNSFSFSQIRSVHFPEFSWAKLYPNPVNQMLYISIRNNRVKKMRLIDLSGRVMHNSEVLNKEMELDMRSFARGMYFVHLEQENGLIAIFKIMHD